MFRIISLLCTYFVYRFRPLDQDRLDLLLLFRETNDRALESGVNSRASCTSRVASSSVATPDPAARTRPSPSSKKTYPTRTLCMRSASRKFSSTALLPKCNSVRSYSDSGVFNLVEPAMKPRRIHLLNQPSEILILKTSTRSLPANAASNGSIQDDSC